MNKTKIKELITQLKNQTTEHNQMMSSQNYIKSGVDFFFTFAKIQISV